MFLQEHASQAQNGHRQCSDWLIGCARLQFRASGDEGRQSNRILWSPLIAQPARRLKSALICHRKAHFQQDSPFSTKEYRCYVLENLNLYNKRVLACMGRAPGRARSAMERNDLGADGGKKFLGQG